MILVGIDPGSRATGVAILDVAEPPADPLRATLWVPGAADVQVLRSWTIRPGGELPIGLRCRRLWEQLLQLPDAEELQVAGVRYVLEDPTGATFAGRGAGGAAAKVGAAFGAAYCAMVDVVASDGRAWPGAELVVVPAQAWLPRVRGRRGAHPMRHVDARRWLQLRWPALEACTDDEVFASGLALYAVTQHPMTVAA